MFKRCSDVADLRNAREHVGRGACTGALILPKIRGTYEIGRYKDRLFIHRM